MSEEQEKPKWYEIRPVYLFICILVILLVIAGVVVMAVGGHVTTCRECAYDTAKTDLQNAVQDYQDKNNGALPTINGTVTINNSSYKIVNICSLLDSQGCTLQYVPDGCTSINGSDNDNCDAGCEGCYQEFSYIWAVDDEGNVHSTCVGEHCNTSGVDGYQYTWP